MKYREMSNLEIKIRLAIAVILAIGACVLVFKVSKIWFIASIILVTLFCILLKGGTNEYDEAEELRAELKALEELE